MGAELKAIRLMVDDYEECIRFYRDVLGCEPHWGDEDTVIIDFEFGSRPTMLALCDRERSETDEPLERSGDERDGLILVFRVEDVDTLYGRLRERGVQFLFPPRDFPDLKVRGTRFRDPGGNLLEINERL
ncbi:MAG: VOC family protein [Bacillota bacterium]